MRPPPTSGPVRSYKRRAGRVTTTQRDALDRLWPTYGVAVDGNRIDTSSLFGRTAPVVLEIGFGMGEATVVFAVAEPDRDVLAVDVHTPGQGNLLKLLEAGGLTNVRVADGDARTLLADMLRPASLAAVRMFFPDPWPKARHAKRRLMDDTFAELIADRLVDGGVLHVATDDPAYAGQVSDVVARSVRLVSVDAPWRPRTRFESRAEAGGRPCYDVAAVRRARPPEGNAVEAHRVLP